MNQYVVKCFIIEFMLSRTNSVLTEFCYAKAL